MNLGETAPHDFNVVGSCPRCQTVPVTLEKSELVRYLAQATFHFCTYDLRKQQNEFSNKLALK